MEALNLEIDFGNAIGRQLLVGTPRCGVLDSAARCPYLKTDNEIGL
jgi:hypothetical protein